ncbi:MAG: sulfurtransferase TusE [Legionellales bacterium]|nr:MAG: sulfurtransferase TusE [Legionellales bacterium]
MDINNLVTESGYLKDFSDWNNDVANELASQEEINLTNEHLAVIYLLQDFYNQYKHSPPIRVLLKLMKENLSTASANSIYLQKLFPVSPIMQACKIAGLPKPNSCI